MKYTELKKGNIYFFIYGSYTYIFIFAENKSSNVRASEYIAVCEQEPYYTGCEGSFANTYDFQKASPSQVAHLMACRNAKTYVEPIKEANYEIY